MTSSNDDNDNVLECALCGIRGRGYTDENMKEDFTTFEKCGHSICRDHDTRNGCPLEGANN